MMMNPNELGIYLFRNKQKKTLLKKTLNGGGGINKILEFSWIC